VIAALYVDIDRGPYPGLLGVDACWGVERDATSYAGSGAVVAHPPCGPWGQMRQFCHLQDRALALVAVEQVRAFGGVLEHPAGSALWRHLRLPMPGDLPLDPEGVWTLAVQQCDWGHKTRKPTWLLFSRIPPSALPPMPPRREPTHALRPPHGYDHAAYRGRHLPKSQRHLTPPAFAAWLIACAETVR